MRQKAWNQLSPACILFILSRYSGMAALFIQVIGEFARFLDARPRSWCSQGYLTQSTYGILSDFNLAQLRSDFPDELCNCKRSLCFEGLNGRQRL